MEPESNSDSEERKAKEKATGERPREAKKGKKSAKYSETPSGMDIIIQKAKRIRIDDPARGRRIENVVKSCYSLRSGTKGIDIDVDVKPTMAWTGRKRKRKTQKRDDLRGPEEVSKRMRRGSGNNNNNNDDDKDETGAPTT